MNDRVDQVAYVRSAARLELTECSREPIHIPGSIQPHGVLLVVDPSSLKVVQASANTQEGLGLAIEVVLGSHLDELFREEDISSLVKCARLDSRPQELMDVGVLTAKHSARQFQGIVSKAATSAVKASSGTPLILELEPPDESSPTFRDLLPFATAFMACWQHCGSLQELLDNSAHQVRRLIGFGRVMVYKFTPSWDGQVIAESKEPDYESYQGQWFPASDIPEQARKLYTLNRLRLIKDASYIPVPVMGLKDGDLDGSGGAPLDMSFIGLRSVSPVHLEYLRNMGVAGSMSISILDRNHNLWGLIACHHREPKHVSFAVRSTCDLLAQSLSLQLQMFEQRSEYEQRLRSKSTITNLLRRMAEQDDFMVGLVRSPDELLAFAEADGCAVLSSDQCTLIGNCPPECEVRWFVEWLISGGGRTEMFHTASIQSEIPGSENLVGFASGALAISISKLHRNYVVWFRQEFVQTIEWSGDPNKAVEQGAADGRIQPRKSFEVWREAVHGSSRPWSSAIIESAKELRSAIIGVVLRKAEELSAMAGELQRSNKELEAFSYTVSHDLRAPFRHIVGFTELLKDSKTAQFSAVDHRYVDTILRSARFGGTLVDNLLKFAQVGRAKLNIRQVDMNQVAAEVRRDLEGEVRRDLEGDASERSIHWEIDQLPTVYGDPVMLRAVMQNLLQNSIKYTRKSLAARVTITSQAADGETVFCVSDNGIGFNQAYAGKLFGVFQRLHRADEYEGTGIGLANVRRMVSRHGGKTWATGEVGKGACFYFSIPFSSPESTPNPDGVESYDRS